MKTLAAFFIILTIIIIKSNKVLLQTLPATLILLALLVTFALILRACKTKRQSKSISLLNSVIIILLFGLLIFTHENAISTSKQATDYFMFVSKSAPIKIGDQNYAITYSNNGWHHGNFCFNLYKRTGIFYKLVDQPQTIVFSSNLVPTESPTWIYHKMILENRTNLTTADSHFTYRPAH